jgi:hypothetical protein
MGSLPRNVGTLLKETSLDYSKTFTPLMVKTTDDFRPIWLLNYSLKCITKLLSTRLQSVFLQLVHKNQYGFNHGRTIQDCVAWAF